MSQNKFPHLFAPLKIGSRTLKNRLFFPAVSTLYAEEEVLTEKDIRFYEARARGGAGLIITGMFSIISHLGAKLRWPGMYDRKFVPQAKKLVDTVHAYGTPVLAQLGLLYHWRQSEEKPLKIVGPSAVFPIYGKMLPRALSKSEISLLISQFREASALSTEAGFDGIEIVACQGNLINRFLSSLTNKREDEYGGNVSNRVRIISEVVQAAKVAGGKGFVVGCRLSVEELMLGGMGIKDYLPICAELEKSGVDYLSIEVGWHESTIPHLHASVPAGNWSHLAGSVKRTVTVPVMTAQRIDSVPLAESILSGGDADIIGMARSLITDPELPNKAKEGKLDEIRPCICCLRCMEEIDALRSLSCSVNPEVGREKEPVTKSDKPRHVLVVGGGPAGIQAAITAAERGNEVELIEGNDHLGGYLVEAAIPPGKTAINDYLTYLRHSIASSTAKVTLNQRITVDTLEKLNPDVVVIATGAKPIIPDIIGSRLPHVLTALSVLHHPEKCKENVVIIGGGLIGLETSLFLSTFGKKITVLEMLERAGADIGRHSRWEILQRVEKAGIKIETATKALEITDKAVIALKVIERVNYTTETVVIATGLVPDKSLQQAISSGKWEVHIIGDCVSPQKIFEAVQDGYRTGVKI